jgi:hypothetical protein
MAKVDIVCCFYRQHALAPFFWWGISENREYINNVIMVNDEPWDDRAIERMQALVPEGVTAVWLDHAHAGKGTHGVARCFNQGLRLAATEHVFLTSADQILQPGTLADSLEFAAEGRIVMGRVDSIDMGTTLADLPEPTVIRPDMYSVEIPALRAQRGQVMVNSWRNGHTLIHLPSHLAIGGFDERFVEWGYGLEDQDYCARWLTAYGEHAIWWGDGASWHFAGAKASNLTNKKEWDQRAVDAMNATLRKMYVALDIPPSRRKVYSRNPDA